MHDLAFMHLQPGPCIHLIAFFMMALSLRGQYAVLCLVEDLAQGLPQDVSQAQFH